jgi:hypothetical protein
MQVLSFDQFHLLLPRPMLHCLFTLYRQENITEFFVPDQSVNAIFFGEAFEDLFAVLRGAANKVGSYTSVKRAIRF